MRGEVSIYIKKDGKIVKRVPTKCNTVSNAVNEFYQTALNGGDYYEERIYIRPGQYYVNYHQYSKSGVTNSGDPYYYNENIMLPIPQKGLGGIMLFDAPFDRSTGHTQLGPLDSHIIGYANQAENCVISEYRGRIVPSSSGQTEDGYRHVWEFPDDTLVGKTIQSLVLTNNIVGNYGPFVSTDLYGYGSHKGDFWRWSAYDGSISGQIFYHDVSGGFFLAASIDDNHLTITKYTIGSNGHLITVGTVHEETLDVDWNYVQSSYNITYGHDGYAYIVCWDDAERDGTISYISINCYNYTVATGHIDMSEHPTATGRIIKSGYFYWQAEENGELYIGRTRLYDGETECRTSSIGGLENTLGGYLIGDSYYAGYTAIPGDLSNNIIEWPCYLEPEPSSSSSRGSKLRLEAISENSPFAVRRIGGNDCALYLNPGYIGTMYNLATPITKSSSNETIVIQYDLKMS